MAITMGLNTGRSGTPEEYFQLYDVTAMHLKACFGDTIKVGGYASCGFGGIYYHPDKYGVDVPQREKDEQYDKAIFRMEFLFDFLRYIRAHESPLDFFSCHSYYDVEKTVVPDAFLHRILAKFGYGGGRRTSMNGTMHTTQNCTEHPMLRRLRRP